MIFNGPRFLLNPRRSWQIAVDQPDRSSLWLVAAALTASIWPAAAVVAGHLGAAALGVQRAEVATLRAAVGLTSVVGGALVFAPALTLILLWSTGAAHSHLAPRRAGSAAMTFLWPVWSMGIVLIIPPLLGWGPEPGELAWIVLAALIVIRSCRREALAAMGVRRRWAKRFMVRFVMAFVIVFVAVVIGPASIARGALGVSTAALPDLPGPTELPTPPEPIW